MTGSKNEMRRTLDLCKDMTKMIGGLKKKNEFILLSSKET